MSDQLNNASGNLESKLSRRVFLGKTGKFIGLGALAHFSFLGSREKIQTEYPELFPGDSAPASTCSSCEACQTCHSCEKCNNCQVLCDTCDKCQTCNTCQKCFSSLVE